MANEVGNSFFKNLALNLTSTFKKYGGNNISLNFESLVSKVISQSNNVEIENKITESTEGISEEAVIGQGPKTKRSNIPSNETKNNKSGLYFDYFEPEEGETFTDEHGRLHLNCKTTLEEISEEEKENGMIKKERYNYTTPGYMWSAIDSHKDIFIYDDGSELTNYYDQSGSIIARQQEMIYKEGCDPQNLKEGDEKIITRRIYNEDGSYYESKEISSWDNRSGEWAWTTNLVYMAENYNCYDANGNLVDRNSDKWEDIRQDASVKYPVVEW